MPTKRLAIVLSHPIQHFCPQYASWAKNLNWQVKVFFASQSGVKPYFDTNFQREVKWANLYLEAFDHHFLNGDRELSITNDIDAPTLEAELNAFQPDILHIYGYIQKLQRRAQRWAKKMNIPALFFSDSELRQKRPLWKETIKKPVLKRFFNDIDWFLTTGNANEEYYLKYGVLSQRFIRSSYPIDATFYEKIWAQKAQHAHTIREQLNIPADSIVVAMVGKLISIKRQVDLIRALRFVEGVSITVLIIGTGENEVTLRAEAEKISDHRVVFVGFIEPDKLPKYYCATDIYCHVSEIEPHSVAISEAIYLGCPVILSDRCGSYGTDDDVQIGKNGFVFPCGHLQALASFIQKLALDKNLRIDMGEISRQIGYSNQMNCHFQVLDTISNLVI